MSLVSAGHQIDRGDKKSIDEAEGLYMSTEDLKARKTEFESPAESTSRAAASSPLRDLLLEKFHDILESEEGVVAPEDLFRAALVKWDCNVRNQFLEVQRALVAPVLSEGEHLRLDEHFRLPFTKCELLGHGAYGNVHRVEIPAAYFEPPPGQRHHLYALKQFSRGSVEVNQRAFNRELAIMRSTRASSHRHMIKLLASFEHRGQYALILPLAEKYLRQFWAQAETSPSTSQWCVMQMAGVSTALSHLHRNLMAQDSRPMRGWHMDIKPENILIVPESYHVSWQISDFGLSVLQSNELPHELPPRPGHGTYEPPECQLELPLSQTCDIWSYGCVISECATWMIKGSAAIEAFADHRMEKTGISGNNVRDDCFFSLEYDESSVPVEAMTRPAVIKWMRDLDRDPKCTKAISDLLRLIEDGLLQVDKGKRLQAQRLSWRLEQISTSVLDFAASNRSSTPEETSNTQITNIQDSS